MLPSKSVVVLLLVTGVNGDASLFGEITGKGLQTGLGTIAGLGYGLPMSRLYAKSVSSPFSSVFLSCRVPPDSPA